MKISFLFFLINKKDFLCPDLTRFSDHNEQELLEQPRENDNELFIQPGEHSSPPVQIPLEELLPFAPDPLAGTLFDQNYRDCPTYETAEDYVSEVSIPYSVIVELRTQTQHFSV